MGPPHNGNMVVLFYANGLAPVYAQIVFPGELVPGEGAFGGDLDAAIPQIPSVTNGPPVSIVNVNSTIGPSHLTYYKRVHGKLVGYKPQGVSVPTKCPKRRLSVLGEVRVPRRQPRVATTTCPARRRPVKQEISRLGSRPSASERRARDFESSAAR